MGFLGSSVDDPADLAAIERVLRDLKRHALADKEQREQFRLRKATQLIKETEARSDIFDPRGHLFGDPGWAIMLAIYVLTMQRRTVSVTDAANASCSPPTTGLRYLTALIAAGFVVREPDWRDRRKGLVALSERGTALLERFLDRTAEI